jgi:hypothetical protein
MSDTYNVKVYSGETCVLEFEASSVSPPGMYTRYFECRDAKTGRKRYVAGTVIVECPEQQTPESLKGSPPPQPPAH